MTEDINYLYRLLNDYKGNLSQKRAEKGEYLALANEIAALCDRLKRDREAVIRYKDEINKFKKTQYSDFTGTQFSSNYLPSIDTISQQYRDLVQKIDNNLDALYNTKGSYERKANACDGPISRLVNSINYIYKKIQNLTN